MICPRSLPIYWMGRPKIGACNSITIRELFTFNQLQTYEYATATKYVKIRGRYNSSTTFIYLCNRDETRSMIGCALNMICCEKG